MNSVTATGLDGWSIVDTLDGSPLNNSDTITIQWPDDTISTTTIQVEVTCDHIVEMGHIVEMKSNRAYIIESVHGAPIRIYLRGNPEIRAERTT
jgi:hypothetical protein